MIALCWIVLCAYCFLGSVAIVVHGSKTIGSPHETTFPEAANVYLAILAGHSGHLYRPFSAPPNVLQPYGPLFYALNMKIAQISRFDVNTVLRLGRLLSFACYILCGLTVYLISRTLEFSTLESTLAASMLLAQPAFLFWNATFRADSITLLAMLASLLVAVRGKNGSALDPAVCGFLAGLALLLKASSIGVAVAILIVWSMKKKYRQCLFFGISLLTPVILTLAILLWHKELFAGQMTSAGKSIWSIASGARWMFSRRSEAMLWAPLTIGAFGCKRAIHGDEKAQIAASFYVCSLLIGLATISQIAGDVNYFQPALAGSSLLLPFAIREFRDPRRTSALVTTLALAVLIAAGSGLAVEWYVQRNIRSVENEKWSGLAPYKVLSDWPLFSLHGREPEYLDPESMHLMELTGNWDSSSFLRRIRNADYDLIVFVNREGVRSFRGISFFGAREITTINSSYRVLCSAGPMLVLRPRSRPITARPETMSAILGRPCVVNPTEVDPNMVLRPLTR